MSVNIHLVARRISDNSVVFDATLYRSQSEQIWNDMQVDINAYPDLTGSLFRDMPGHLAVPILESIPHPPKLLLAFKILLQHTSGLNASIFWS